MTRIKEITLEELKKGEEGTIIDFMGGHTLKRKLDALGLRPGKKITKISNMMMNGPVTVKINDGSRVAIGRGMAAKIVVKVEG